MKVVRVFMAEPIEQQAAYNTKYFPPHPMFHYLTKLLRMQGLMVDQHMAFSDLQDYLRMKRGRAPYPKIGQGKRAMLRASNKK
jgi:hypothetical protein